MVVFHMYISLLLKEHETKIAAFFYSHAIWDSVHDGGADVQETPLVRDICVLLTGQRLRAEHAQDWWAYTSTPANTGAELFR